MYSCLLNRTGIEQQVLLLLCGISLSGHGNVQAVNNLINKSVKLLHFQGPDIEHAGSLPHCHGLLGHMNMTEPSLMLLVAVLFLRQGQIRQEAAPLKRPGGAKTIHEMHLIYFERQESCFTANIEFLLTAAFAPPFKHHFRIILHLSIIYSYLSYAGSQITGAHKCILFFPLFFPPFFLLLLGTHRKSLRHTVQTFSTMQNDVQVPLFKQQSRHEERLFFHLALHGQHCLDLV